MDSPTNIPDDLRRFILTSIPSVAYLEAILLLRKEPGEAMSPAAVARGLYMSEARAAELLTLLEGAGVAGMDPANQAAAYRYAPSPELAAMLDRLANAYAADLVGVTDLIHSGVGKRAFQFADAFRWRKDT